MKRRLLCSLGALAVAAAMLCSGPAVADPHDRGNGGYHGQADNRGHGGYQMDQRYQHNRYYPPRGYVAPQLPHEYHEAHYGHDRYYYGGGVWYRPYGYGYSVVAPPIGVAVSFLPDFYTTLWFGGIPYPYYYANSVYYVQRPGVGYVVTDPPSEAPIRTEPPAPAPNGEDFFMYPRNGQSADVQARDRYECHSWAVSQTGFDPTQSAGGVAPAELEARRADYLRAITACLDARGYTVR